MASCVSKSWSLAMSSDHVWRPLCSSRYPSLCNLKISLYHSVPYHRLYAIGLSAFKRGFKPPSAPVITIAEPASKMINNVVQGNQVFKFDIGVNDDRCFPGVKALEETTMKWNVV
ncbi:hypothetical protein QQP08_016209 [Theobroma cacao]|nr:hypothetical protein QQP08_016209 [Theobroma cacao]